MAAMDPNKDGGQSTLLSSRDLPMFISCFEDMSRRCVRGVLQELSLSINLPPQPLPDPSIQAQYRLQFINKVKDTTFTTDLVRDENENPIKVAIYNMYGQPIISPDCFLSSAKVRITVLDAEFWKNKGVNWSRSEFNQRVLKKREGKGPILIGHSLIIRLENGVGTFENIVFNDNSKWTKSGFGLGVMVEGEGQEGYLNGERVQEGVSESFRVKDCRGKASQKPDQLKLTHKVQSLKKVGKKRSSFLRQKKMKTVEDFLKLYYNDEPALREILCIKSESDKGWKSMVKHAMQCADEFQAKYNDLNNSSQHRQVSMNNEVNILNPNTTQFYFEYPINKNISLGSPLEEVMHRRTSHQNLFDNWPYANCVLSLNLKQNLLHLTSMSPLLCYNPQVLVHTPGRTVSLQTNGGPRLVGSVPSVPNSWKNNLIIPAGQDCASC